MPKPAGHRNAAVTTVRCRFWPLRVALVGACSVAPARVVGPGYHAGDLDRIARAGRGLGYRGRAARQGQSITTHLRAPDGTQVATAKFEFSNGYATVTIADDRPRSAGARIPRGAHPQGRQVRAQLGRPDRRRAGRLPVRRWAFPSARARRRSRASGDLTSLQVRKDGTAMLVTTTDAFTLDDLLDRREDRDHHPRRRRQLRQHSAGAIQPGQRNPGPDQMTMSTGDAGKRVACGVIGAG